MQEQVDEKSASREGERLLQIDRREPGVAVMTMNRAATRNCLSLAMIDALHLSFLQIAREEDVHAIVLAGAGPVFCAGHDLKELTARRADPDHGLSFFQHTMTRCSIMMQSIVACPKPVIAAVEGTATAAGCQLVATCDLAVAAEEASFCTPGVNIGLFCSTPMVALSRNVSRKHAMEMLLLGDLVPAAKAAEIGLVNRVVAKADVMKTALELARQIADKSSATVAIGKRAFYEQIEMGLADAYQYATKVMTENMMARDAAEGINAFLEKRKPEWKGR